MLRSGSKLLTLLLEPSWVIPMLRLVPQVEDALGHQPQVHQPEISEGIPSCESSFALTAPDRTLTAIDHHGTLNLFKNLTGCECSG